MARELAALPLRHSSDQASHTQLYMRNGDEVEMMANERN